MDSTLQLYSGFARFALLLHVSCSSLLPELAQFHIWRFLQKMKIQFASWRQFRRVWTNLPIAKSCRRCEGTGRQSWPSLQFPVLLVTDKWRHNDVILEKVINIDQNSRSQTAMESVVSFPNCRPNPSIGSRRALVAKYSVHTADATQIDSWVASASAVCTGH